MIQTCIAEHTNVKSEEAGQLANNSMYFKYLEEASKTKRQLTYIRGDESVNVEVKPGANVLTETIEYDIIYKSGLYNLLT